MKPYVTSVNWLMKPICIGQGKIENIKQFTLKYWSLKYFRSKNLFQELSENNSLHWILNWIPENLGIVFQSVNVLAGWLSSSPFLLFFFSLSLSLFLKSTRSPLCSVVHTFRKRLYMLSSPQVAQLATHFYYFLPLSL